MGCKGIQKSNIKYFKLKKDIQFDSNFKVYKIS